MAAIDPQVSTSHEARGVAYEEDRRASVLVWPTQLAEHVLRGPVSSPFWILFKECLDHRSDDVPWRYGIDSDAMLSPFRRKIPGELDHAGFRGVVRRAYESLCRVSWTHLACLDMNTTHTRLATVALMEAISAIEPPFPCRIISLATA